MLYVQFVCNIQLTYVIWLSILPMHLYSIPLQPVMMQYSAIPQGLFLHASCNTDILKRNIYDFTSWPIQYSPTVCKQICFSNAYLCYYSWMFQNCHFALCVVTLCCVYCGLHVTRSIFRIPLIGITITWECKENNLTTNFFLWTKKACGLE